MICGCLLISGALTYTRHGVDTPLIESIFTLIESIFTLIESIFTLIESIFTLIESILSLIESIFSLIESSIFSLNDSILKYLLTRKKWNTIYVLDISNY